MSRLSSFQSRRTHSRTPARIRKPWLEQLEDRSVPSLLSHPALSYSTYLSPGKSGDAQSIAVDTSGNAYLAESYVAKLNSTGSALDYQNSAPFIASAIALDSSGDAWVTGLASSGFTPTSNAYQPTSSTGKGAFLAELDPNGNVLYASYLSGSSMSWGNAIAVDSSGNVYVAGQALAGFPTTANAFQSTFAGGTYTIPGYGPATTTNAFLAEIDPNLSGSAQLVYSTYLGGSGSQDSSGNTYQDFATGIGLDGQGNVFITGVTGSSNFPTTAGAFQPADPGGNVNAFVAKFNTSLSGSASLLYSTYLGGSGNDGQTTSTLIYNSYPNPFPVATVPAIAVDSSGNAYVTGPTGSTDFPTTTGTFQTHNSGKEDAFVTKINPAGSALVYSTYLGGSGQDEGSGIAVDQNGNAYVVGATTSTSFPVTRNAIQPKDPSNPKYADSSAYVSVLNATGSGLLYSSYLGGSYGDAAFGIALDGSGNAYVSGRTSSTNFPTTTGAYQTTFNSSYWTNEFVTKIDPPAEGEPASSPTLPASASPEAQLLAFPPQTSVPGTGPGTQSDHASTSFTGILDDAGTGPATAGTSADLSPPTALLDQLMADPGSSLFAEDWARVLGG
jgi:hypothetical protein